MTLKVIFLFFKYKGTRLRVLHFVFTPPLTIQVLFAKIYI